jgi:hypothetical protein
MVTNESELLVSPRAVLAKLDKHAATLGLPRAGATAAPPSGPAILAAGSGKEQINNAVLAALRKFGFKGKGGNGGGGGGDGGGGGGGTPRKPPPTGPTTIRPNFGKNDCDCCPIDACEALKWAKALKCSPAAVCLARRKVDPTATPPTDVVVSLGPGDITMTRLCRGYLKLNPMATTLKGLTFAVIRKGSGEPKLSGKQSAAQLGNSKQATPLMSLQEFMGEQVTDQSAFLEWLNGLDANMQFSAPRKMRATAKQVHAFVSRL